MSRWYPRRRTLSRRPENVRRRMQNRMMKALAALVIGGVAWAWHAWQSPSADAVQTRAPVVDAGGMVKPETGPVAKLKPVKVDADGVAGDVADASAIDNLFALRRSNVVVTVEAPVARVLVDDREGDRHQRFTLKLPSGKRVLVAHNIDLAPRVARLQAGDVVTVRGEYEWDERGGVLHWTHHDPAGRHEGGWILHEGKKYQ